MWSPHDVHVQGVWAEGPGRGASRKTPTDFQSRQLLQGQIKGVINQSITSRSLSKAGWKKGRLLDRPFHPLSPPGIGRSKAPCVWVVGLGIRQCHQLLHRQAHDMHACRTRAACLVQHHPPEPPGACPHRVNAGAGFACGGPGPGLHAGGRVCMRGAGADWPHPTPAQGWGQGSQGQSTKHKAAQGAPGVGP